MPRSTLLTYFQPITTSNSEAFFNNMNEKRWTVPRSAQIVDKLPHLLSTMIANLLEAQPEIKSKHLSEQGI